LPRTPYLLGCFLLLACGTELPKPVPPAPPVEIAPYLDGLANQGQLTGVVYVSRRGSVLLQKAYGLADEKTGALNRLDTQFRIGSNTKQFAAMALWILHGDGKLDLTDRICAHLPDCPPAWSQITLQQLVDHTSGIPDDTNLAGFPSLIGTSTTVDALIARFRDLPLEFTPGSRWAYSNSGYVLISKVVSVVLSPGVRPVHLAMSEFDAAGALASTVEDLARWDEALLAGKVLPAADIAEVFRPKVACPQGGCALATDVGYADGWFVAQENGARYVYHWGRIDGFRSSNGFYPDEDLLVIVLSNLETVDTFGISTRLGTMARAQKAQ